MITLHFIDNKQRAWPVVPNTSSFLRMSRSFDLLAHAHQPEKLAELDAFKLCDVLYDLCQPPMLRPAFFAGISGEQIEEGYLLLRQMTEVYMQPIAPMGGKAPVGRRSEQSTTDIWPLVWALAGVLAIDPGPFTLGQLDRMASEKLKTDWDHTAELSATIRNMAGKISKTKHRPAEINPFRHSSRGTRVTADNLDSMMQSFFGPTQRKVSNVARVQ